MPPKAQKEKVKKQVEDKTFGLKNKKSAKVQKFIHQVNEQAEANSKHKPTQSQIKKEFEAKKNMELLELFKPVQVQKVPFGTDPKTMLCQFFKAGACTKGKSCKFSHDLDVDRKATKIDIYTDARATTATSAATDEAGKEADNMDNWDQQKLEEVVKKKHGLQPTTDIVCKFFIQAVEDRKYGWFWQCPNGDDCKYKHALPPGFVLKDQRKKTDDVAQTLEEWIEEQRSQLPQKLTPVSLESFNKWKAQRLELKQKEEMEKSKQREAAVRAGRSIGASGRELFTYNPDAFNFEDDDEAMEIDYTQREDDNEEEPAKEGNPEDEEESAEIDAAAFEGVSLEDLDE